MPKPNSLFFRKQGEFDSRKIPTKLPVGLGEPPRVKLHLRHFQKRQPKTQPEPAQQPNKITRLRLHERHERRRNEVRP